MITMSYGALRSNAFRQAMVKLGSDSNVSQVTALKIINISKKLEEKLAESQSILTTVLCELVNVENNLFQLNADKTEFEWKDGVNAEDAKKNIIEYANTLFSVDADKLTLAELEPVKLSAIEISLLSPLIENLLS